MKYLQLLLIYFLMGLTSCGTDAVDAATDTDVDEQEEIIASAFL